MASTLVIGGTGGIGASIVRRFAREGHSVHFTYLRAHRTAEDIVEAGQQDPGKVTASQLDLRDDDAIVELVNSQPDDLETVVFAAASGVQRPFGSFRRKHLEWSMAVNFRSCALLFQKALPKLNTGNGSMLYFTSSGSRFVLPHYFSVAASKAAGEAMIRYAAVYSGRVGVRVNGICSGLVDTKAIHTFPRWEHFVADTADRTPMGRLVACDEVAEVAWWLASPAARMVTGHILVVDGGYEISQMLRPGDEL